MTKIAFIWIALLFILCAGCEKSETIQFSLNGKLKGKIFARNEFGYSQDDNEDITIKLEGSDPLLYTTTDHLGNYEIDDIPTGTYNVIISKDGYGEMKIQSYSIVGGNLPMYLNNSLTEISHTIIENLSATFVEHNLNIECTISHNYVINEWSLGVPIMIFIDTSSNPSSNNNIGNLTIYCNVASGEKFETSIYGDYSFLHTGKPVYIIAYGTSNSYSYYYDYTSNKYIYPHLGAPSNIANIVIQ